MKRRTFLSMFGAASVAPALPAMATAPSASVFGAAAAHARAYPYISVIGLAKRTGVSVPEAETLLHRLSQKGLVGQVHFAGARPIHAGSRVFVPTEGSLIKAAQTQRARQAARRRAKRLNERATEFRVDLSDFLAHLRDICTEHGMTLHPRCRYAVA